MHYFIDAFKKYAVFQGRSRRSEFWCFYLVNFIVSFLLGQIMGPLSLIYTLAVLVPSLSLSTRRLHDIGKSGWNNLWALTIIGAIPLIIWWAKDGDKGDNAYGSDPKIVE